jgi:malate/lactate dehydrogenase
MSIGVPILLQDGQCNRIKNIEISSYENELFIKSANQLEKQYLSLIK